MSHDPGRSWPVNVGTPDAIAGLQELEARLLLSVTPLGEPGLVEPDSASQAEVLAATSGTHTFGIDVSHFQNDAGGINWNSVKSSGKDFVWIKATEGVDFVDHQWVNNITSANSAGLLAGGYHFATPYTGGVNDAAAEASDFYDAVSPYLGDGFLRPALDLERGNTLSTSVLSNWVHDFMNAFSALSGGIVPTIYMNSNYASSEVNSSVNIYDLWLANWPGNPDFNNPPSNDGVWNGYDLWQYSDSTSVSGINGNVDGDVFFGDLAAFTAKYAINTTPPPPDDHGDNAGTATAIAVPSTTAGVIGAASDTDWFSLTLNAGDDYTFTLLDNGLGSGELRLYTSTSTLISTDTGPAAGGTLAELTFTAVVGDTYYLAVDASGTGGYDLAVQETDDHGDSIGTASALGTLALGGIQVSGDADYFSFAATAGMDYDIKVQDFGIADATLTLYTAGGAVVSQDSGSSPGGTHAQILWTASSTGTMYVAVTAQSGTVGDYFLTLAETNPLLAGDLDGDGFVGISDLNVVLGNWNQNVTPGDLLSGDPNGDGFVGIDDLNVVLGNWNAGTPPVAATGGSQSESTASSVAAAEPEVVATTAATTTKASASERASKRRDRRVATTPVRTDRAQGLAIANWRVSERSAFGDRSGDQYTPAMGLWEQDDEG
jgi:lysozyme